MIRKSADVEAVQGRRFALADKDAIMPHITDQRPPSTQAARGYHAVYRDGSVNHCPGCGRTHWYVGRLLAECGFCSTALPLENSTTGFGRMTQPTPDVELAGF
jgi:hypothetical protein